MLRHSSDSEPGISRKRMGRYWAYFDPDGKRITNRGEITSWGFYLSAAQGATSRQKARSGAGLRFLSGPVTSPSLAEIMATVLAEYPQAKWHQYDPVSRDGARMAAAGTGAPAEPIYHFDKADVIVALDADVLTCGPGTVRYQKDFAARRRVTDDKK